MVLSFDRLIERQSELLGLISRSITNLHKLGADKVTDTAVEARLKILEGNWNKFQDNHESLCGQRTEANRQLPYFVDDLYSQCEELYIETSGRLMGILKRLRLPASTTQSLDETTSSSSLHSRSLPKVNLPRFSGVISEWIPFRDLFDSMIGKNTNLSNVERLHYLRTHVSGEAERLILNLPITDSNFEVAWITLQSHYENKRLLANGLFDTIFALKPLTRESASDLQTILATVKQAISGLEQLGALTDAWDPIIVYICTRLLDPETLKSWEITQGAARDLENFKELENFLLARIRGLSAVETRSGFNKPSPATTSKASKKAKSPSAKSHVATNSASKCALCSAAHYIASCPEYRDNKTAQQRREIIEKKQLCYNCLGSHKISACRTSKRCLICGQQHHTTIHGTVHSTASIASTPQSGAQSDHNTSPAVAAPASSLHVAVGAQLAPIRAVNAATSVAEFEHALLATAVVDVSSRNRTLSARVLLDQGSELSFVSEALVQALRIERKRAAIPLVGIGAQPARTTRGMVEIEIRSRIQSTFSCRVTAYILPRVTAQIPTAAVRDATWVHLTGIQLADPNFNVPGRIDLLLGAEIYGSLLRDGLRQGLPGAPIAQSTALGWIVSGPISSARPVYQGISNTAATFKPDLDQMVERFWEQESVPPTISSRYSDEEQQCEEHFMATHSRSPHGRYLVRLPFRRSPIALGNSRAIAAKTLSRVQRRCALNNEYRDLYTAFLQEYEELNHMSRVSPSSADPDHVFYLPHHGVFKTTSSTTKLRVVFNGSQQTDTGLSLNDCLHSGPKLQLDLAEVLLRWRLHQFVFTADIEKMYRQVLVHPQDWDYQRILWAPTALDETAAYHLRTVTYGLACAPYLALRVLRQLAADEGSRFPLAKDILHSEIYVDDVLSGADTIDLARSKMRQLDQLLRAGGFILQKWASNDSQLDAMLDTARRASNDTLHLDSGPLVRALGLTWQTTRDCFIFQVHHKDDLPKFWTKRSVLSAIARLFDPLGWLSPITVAAKIFFQRLWREELGWDDPLSAAASQRWITFYGELSTIESISMPRWLGTSPSKGAVELHGFSDASNDALSACVYLRILDEDCTAARITLVAAKTRVTPIKPVTIPRLELSAAVLLARLMAWVRGVIAGGQLPIHLWTDSTVTLAWISGPPSRWKEFVANRVALIAELVPTGRWHHIAGADNPADVASRGLSPSALRLHHSWWHGPSWLNQPSPSWPVSSQKLLDVDLEERARVVAVAVIPATDDFMEILGRYSRLSLLLRVTAWVVRAVTRLRRGNPAGLTDVNTPLDPEELSDALLLWTRKVQRVSFGAEVDQLTRGLGIARSSRLVRLSPFLDEAGTLRVGGRLKFSRLDPDSKHPTIMPRSSLLTTLLIDDAHRRTFHGGVQSTLSTLRRAVWILGGRSVVRAHILRCVTCARQRARTAQQLMGQLPKPRVVPSRPFTHTGVDYAGPYQIKTWRGRAAKTYKGYLVVFVCFSTSAVHLELATDYSSAGFLAAYRRFSGRRGVSATLTSDCGTNLVGADAELRRLFSAASKDWRNLASTLASDGTQWRFHPPGAPHFGGKWEAAVKSVKFHLRRIVGTTLLTYEEFSTLLAQIEAVLNSRPICPLSDDPEDLEALTPGHFLVGGPISTPPEPSLSSETSSRLTRWQLVRQMVDVFWQRWSTEYLQRLQGISKWQQSSTSIQPGVIVLVVDERYPPTKWPLGRVIAVHPGADGHVRVASVRTATTVLRRPIVKLCPLPVDAPQPDDAGQ